MDPADDELIGEANALDTLGKIYTWLGASAELSGAINTTFGSTDATHPRLVAAMTDSNVVAINATIKIPVSGSPSRDPTPIERSIIDLVHVTCKKVCKVILRATDQAAADASNRAHQLALAKAAPAPSSAVAAPQPLVKKIKLNLLDQYGDSTEVEVLKPADIANLYKTFHVAMGGAVDAVERILPRPSCEPTMEQLSALHALLKLGSCFVDFSSFTRNNDDLMRRRAFRAMLIGPDGALMQSELKGPTCYEEWEEAWAVYKVAMVMLAQWTLETPDLYSQKIKAYHVRYGKDVWGLLSQSDHRARFAHLERHRRRGQLEYDAELAAKSGVVANVKHGFNPAKPWDWSLRQLCGDTEFWNDQFVEPALLIKTHIKAQNQFVTQDVYGHHEGDEPRSSGAEGSANRRKAALPEVPAPTKTRQPRQHLADGDKYTHNRSGLPLCSAFNSEQGCGDMVFSKRERKYVCPKDSRTVHQCAKCLSDKHGATSSSCPGSTTQSASASKGRGKGRGRKGRK